VVKAFADSSRYHVLEDFAWVEVVRVQSASGLDLRKL
jgi:hypothetical protein